MKKMNKNIYAFGLAALALSVSSCIDEVEPTTVATEEQIQKSESATEGLVQRCPAFPEQSGHGFL